MKDSLTLWLINHIGYKPAFVVLLCAEVIIGVILIGIIYLVGCVVAFGLLLLGVQPDMPFPAFAVLVTVMGILFGILIADIMATLWHEFSESHPQRKPK